MRINSQLELPLEAVRARVGAHRVRSPARLNYSLQTEGRGILNDLKKHVICETRVKIGQVSDKEADSANREKRLRETLRRD